MLSTYSIDDKIKYIKWKMENDSTPLSEKLDIIDFLMNHAGLFGKRLRHETFARELNKLTADMNLEEIDQ